MDGVGGVADAHAEGAAAAMAAEEGEQKVNLTCVLLFIFIPLPPCFFLYLFKQCGLLMGIYGLMETSYLKAHPFGSHYPEWMPNLHSDRGQDLNPCAQGSQGHHSVSGFTVPRWHEFLCFAT